MIGTIDEIPFLMYFTLIRLIFYRSREISTTDNEYVRWTQWIFLQLFKQGLAAQSEVSVNWCPALGRLYLFSSDRQYMILMYYDI